MGVLDKFLDIMKLCDDDDYEDDLFDDEYEDLEEEKPKKSFFKKEKKFDFDEEDDDFFETKQKPVRQASANKVTPMRQSNRKSNMEVCVIKPTTVDDAREITETLLVGSTVNLN